MFSCWFQMLIFGHWLDCLLEGFNLKKMMSPFFGPFHYTFLSDLNSSPNRAKYFDYITQKNNINTTAYKSNAHSFC